MKLSDGTTLRGLLSHLQSNARKQAVLYGTYMLHPDNKGGEKPETGVNNIEDLWESIRRDIPKVLGEDVQLVRWSELALEHTFTASGSRGHTPASGAWVANDPYRVTLGVLKKKADLARLKDPTIDLMRAWTSKPVESR